MGKDKKVSWLQFFWRITSCHMVSYFIMGILGFYLLNYTDLYSKAILSVYMRPTNSPWVTMGASFQIIRGILFAFVLWPIKNVFLESKNGWLKLWLVFLGLAVLGAAGAAPGSIEGLIYTRLPLRYHLINLPEVIIQTLIFSITVFVWHRKPGKIWNIFMAAAVVLIVFMTGTGAFLHK